MSSGADDHDARTAPPDLDSLRARLYAPDATEADRAAYDEAVAQGTASPSSRGGPPVASPADPVPDTDSHADLRPPPRIRPVTAALAAVALLAVGAGLGVGLGTAGGRSSADATPSSVRSSSAAVSAPPLPLPVAARTLRMSGTARDAAVRRLTKVFASGADADASILTRSVEAVGSELSDPATSGDWMSRYDCSTSTGLVRASAKGRPVVVTANDGALALPARSHLRITILMTRPAAWSWVLSAERGTTPDAPVAVGAGSPEAGAVQYAEFDGTGTGTLTRVMISTTSSTPFLWQLESCISGG